MEWVNDIEKSESSAIENLSLWILRNGFKVLTLGMTHLYNECLWQGKFPEDWG